jgi:nucleotide-binding universal stress UspA family protein
MTGTPARSGLILVAVAGAAASEPALRYAGAEALRTGGSVRIVHVLTGATTSDVDDVSEQAADRLRELTRGRVPVEALDHSAPLVPALVAHSRDASLVVLQRRHRTRLQWLLEGSRSTLVAGQAHAPTVWVPEDWRDTDAVGFHVVVGVDAAEDEECLDLLRHACQRADERGASLTVVHGWQLSSGYDDAVLDRLVVAEWADRYQGALQRRLSVVRAEHPAVPVEVEIVHLPPAEALVQASKDAVLLVLARGRLGHPLVGHLGSVARAVMRDAACPVEIILDPRGQRG